MTTLQLKIQIQITEDLLQNQQLHLQQVGRKVQSVHKDRRVKKVIRVPKEKKVTAENKVLQVETSFERL
jgi:hypothetical protein